MSDYDKSLEDIIKERKFVKKPRVKAVPVPMSSRVSVLAPKVQRQLVGRLGRTVGIVTKRLQHQGQLRSNVNNAGARQGQIRPLLDARTKINQKQRTQVVRDAREMLSKKAPQIVDARHKLNINSRKRVTWEWDGYEEALASSAATLDQLTRTVKNTHLGGKWSRNLKMVNLYIGICLSALKWCPVPVASRLVRLSLSMYIDSFQPNNRQKHVVMTKGGLTVIRTHHPGQKASIESAGSSLFARTFDALVKEKSSEQILAAKRGRNAALVPAAVKRKFSDDYEDDYEFDVDDEYVAVQPTQSVNKANSRHFNKPKVVAAAITNEGPSASISRGLQMRLGANDGGAFTTNASGNAGFKIRVTNLHTKVTLEDLKELYGDVGSLVNVILYKQGIADIIYKNLIDAKKAIDNYHDRELDGQPMRCKFVKQPMETVRESRLSKYLKTGTLHSDRIPSAGVTPTVGPATSGSRIKPDVNVIHKALFHRNASRHMAANRNASITVTM